MPGVCEQNEVTRLRLGDQGIHARHDVRARNVGVEQNDGLDPVPAERFGNVLGVRPSALQLHGCRQSRIDVDADDKRADRPAARRSQIIGQSLAGLRKRAGGRRASGGQEQHQFAHGPFPSNVEGPQSGAPWRIHSTRRSSAQASSCVTGRPSNDMSNGSSGPLPSTRIRAFTPWESR